MAPEKEYVVKDVAEWRRVASDLMSVFAAGHWYALHGPMGAGKTTFAQALVAVHAGIGCAGTVTSPTFDLCHRYPGQPDILHYDLYRFDADSFGSQSQALASIDWHLVEAADAIALVEWPENLPASVSAPAAVLQFSYTQTGRKLVLQSL